MAWSMTAVTTVDGKHECPEQDDQCEDDEGIFRTDDGSWEYRYMVTGHPDPLEWATKPVVYDLKFCPFCGYRLG